MRTDSPGPVVAQIGSIEDSLAIEQNAHAEAKGLEFQLGQQLKLLRAGFMETATGNSAEDRKAWVERQLEDSSTYNEWCEAKVQLLKHEVRLDYLSKRLMACQSVLNHFRWDGQLGRYGQGAPQGDG